MILVKDCKFVHANPYLLKYNREIKCEWAYAIYHF